MHGDLTIDYAYLRNIYDLTKDKQWNGTVHSKLHILNHKDVGHTQSISCRTQSIF